jgi:hypothetical protein
VKSIIINGFLVLAAAASVIFLLAKGGKAGVSNVKQVSAPVGTTVATAAPIRPQTIQGQLDNFNGPITLKPIRSWGTDPKHGFMLAVSASPALDQPRARAAFAYPTAAPTVFDIEYTVPQRLFEAIEANPAARDRFAGVAVQVTTQGAAYNTSALLKLDPKRCPDHRKWRSCNLILPPATKEVHFLIVGIPPDYNVFAANCAISLPQLRLTAASVPSAHIIEPHRTPGKP